MRTIDADELKELLIETLESILKNPAMTHKEMHVIAACGMLAEMIDDAPTIDVEPVLHGEWISVKDRLPEGGSWVLVYCGGMANWFDLNKWCGDCWLKHIPVTHWMPLPEPPKEDT